MKRFVIENFPDDLARRINVYIASSGDTRRDLVVRAVEERLKVQEEEEKKAKR